MLNPLTFCPGSYSYLPSQKKYKSEGETSPEDTLTERDESDSELECVGDGISDSTVFISPLKLPSQETSDKKLDFSKKRLFSNRDDKPISPDHLSSTYQYNFQSPSCVDNKKGFFHIQELVAHIEGYLEKSTLSPLEKQAIREKVKTSLSLHVFSLKMAELGLVLFYLDRDGQLPNCQSLLEHRNQQMETQVQELVREVKEVCKDPGVASGKTHYLMRAFARMAMTSDQFLNIGGLTAIKALLISSGYTVSRHLQPEHRDHILVIVNQLITHSGIHKLFQRKINIYPDLANAVRLDLKFSPSDRIESNHVFYDCLMALFVDIRQVDGPNCYAIAALAYATENHPFIVLSKMLEYLESGHLNIGTTQIPIAPLLNHRITDTREVSVLLQTNKAISSLSTLCHLFDRLSITPQNEKVPSHSQSVKDLLAKILHAENKSDVLPYAEKLFFTYKYNAIAYMLLAALEFTYLNSPPSRLESDRLPTFSSLEMKDFFISESITSMGIIAKREDPISVKLFSVILEKLRANLWFENINEKPILDEKKSQITLQIDLILEKKGLDVESLVEVYSQSTRLFHFNGNEYLLIKTLSQLQSIFQDVLKELEAIKENIPFCSEIQSLQKSCQSQEFRDKLSTLMTNQINDRLPEQSSKLAAKYFERADLCVFLQQGGKGDVVLHEAFGIELRQETITDCRSPYDLLEKLLKKLTTLDPKVLKSAPKILIRSPGLHIWTLAPHCWETLLKNQNDFKGFMQKELFDKGVEHLNSRAQKGLINKIIDIYSAGNQKLKEIMKNHFEEHPDLTYAEVRDTLKNKVHPSKRALIESILQEEYSKVQITKDILNKTIRELNIAVSNSIFNELFKKFENERLFPHVLALSLREDLIAHKVAIVDLYNIEVAVCKASQLPIPIHLGDMNWVDERTESPFHQHLVIRFDWIKQVPLYYLRRQTKESLEDPKNYQDMMIGYPKMLTDY